MPGSPSCPPFRMNSLEAKQRVGDAACLHPRQGLRPERVELGRERLERGAQFGELGPLRVDGAADAGAFSLGDQRLE